MLKMVWKLFSSVILEINSTKIDISIFNSHAAASLENIALATEALEEVVVLDY